MTGKIIQLLLNLKKKKIYEKEDFLVSSSNKNAFDLVNIWPNWISRKLIILGDSGTGKTHLSKIWKNKSSAIHLSFNKFEKTSVETFFKKKKKFIIENPSFFFKKVNEKKRTNIEKKFLHFYNLIEEKKGYLILTVTIAPKFWKINLPDLKSRILSSMFVKIKKPNDQLLYSVLIKLFADKQILIDKKIIQFIVYRSERSFINLQKIVNKIDNQSLLKKKKINLNFIKEII